MIGFEDKVDFGLVHPRSNMVSHYVMRIRSKIVIVGMGGRGVLKVVQPHLLLMLRIVLHG